jgi:predicted nucleic acid-binding protein
MKKYVVDASVILTEVLDSRKELSDSIKKYLISAEKGKIELYSSEFLKMEVANGIRFNEKDISKARKILRISLKLPIKFILLDPAIYEESLSISFKLGTTVYDTSYHILAKAQNATFLTCDEEYYKKAKSLGDIELIR